MPVFCFRELIRPFSYLSQCSAHCRSAIVPSTEHHQAMYHQAMYLYVPLGVIFYTSGTDDKEMRSRVIQAKKCIARLNGILWSKDIRKERKLNIYNALIKSILLYGSETWRLTENNKRRVEATEMDALKRSLRISRKE